MNKWKIKFTKTKVKKKKNVGTWEFGSRVRRSAMFIKTSER